MFRGAQLEQAETEQRAAREIERPQRFFGDQLADLRFQFRFGEFAEIERRQRKRRERSDGLRRLSINHAEGRSQALVAADDFVQASFQGRDVQLSAQPNGAGHVVSGVARLQLIHEPEPLLSERERQTPIPRNGLQGRRLKPVRGAHRRFDALRQTGDRRRFKEASQRQFHLERFAHARKRLRGQQRMPAQIEEAVMNANLSGDQNLRPDSGQRLFDLCSRRDIDSRRLRPHRIGRGQRAAIHLAVRRQRQRIQFDEDGRRHVLRQLLPQEVSQFCAGRRGAGFERDIRRQTFLASHIFSGQHRRFTHRLMLSQHRFDLRQFDAEAANLHLMIEPPQKFDGAIRPVTRQVSCSIKPRARFGAERIRNELLSRQLWPVKVASRQSIAADEQLSHDADRRGL
ncbi:MAG: hypothetical protein HONDAALG_02413 [Gammaproteobacteria bacterium]|nr:hypothetical protein [Gammaproteobacteria bacterium]